ncbi:hypothetical protein BDQ12DRAFT_608927 [Crucibulum laeve]|uniref:Uncharacterized protein n=1 Tax=Crucibulum laeve TaxID=68775 RepID=A0A5C3LVX1_9AGAR|nr:hypothetical protein BDQ12DRAFT_608927 [Crucibulum laeve]
MPISPAPSSSRGDLVLQPGYFTSSVYVKAVRDDITSLILLFHEQYSQNRPAQPFLLFKDIWTSQGWKWLHFKVFDDRARKAFLDVTMRLFLERMAKTEAPFSRVVALFGLYTFFYSQPKYTAPPLYSVSHISIPVDHYLSLKALPGVLTTEQLLPLQPRVICILSRLLTDQVFCILPRSELRPMNPGSLPREIYIEAGTVLPIDPNAPKKKGRPTKRDKAQKAKAALDGLDRWLEKTSCTTDGPREFNGMSFSAPMTHSLVKQAPAMAVVEYQVQKSQLLEYLDPADGRPSSGRTALKNASEQVVGRLKEAEELMPANETEAGAASSAVAGMQRIERVRGERGGVLSLLEGGGRV